MSATADQELAELRRAYQEMRSERDSALAALALRNTEYGERIEQQAATIDVLKVMSASPDDALPVFRLVVERARAFCEADGASLALLKNDMLHLQAYSGYFHPDYESGFHAKSAAQRCLAGLSSRAMSCKCQTCLWTPPTTHEKEPSRSSAL